MSDTPRADETAKELDFVEGEKNYQAIITIREFERALTAAEQLIAEREGRIAELIEALELSGMPTVGYYLQDKRSFVGNDMLWWAKNGNGYTTDLRKAHVYSDDEFAKGASRDTDIFWPVAYINSLARPVVDMQYAKRSALTPPQPDAASGEGGV